MLNLFYIRGTAEQRSGVLQQMSSVIVAIAVVFSLFGAVETARAKTPAVSEPAPDFALRGSSGHNLRLSEFRGDVVIVNFWSASCGRCRDQLDRLDSINAANGPNYMSILSINVDSDSSAARRAIAAEDFGFPVLFDTEKIVSRLYDPSQLPMTFIVDPHGTVRYIHKGYSRGDEVLYAQEIAKLLAE